MDTLPLLPGETPDAQGETRARLIVRLIQSALTAPDIPSAVLPAPEVLVAHTAAVGAAYFQVVGESFTLHSGSGTVPQGPAMDALLAHGLPYDALLLRALEQNAGPLFLPTPRAPLKPPVLPQRASPALPPPRYGTATAACWACF